MRRFPCQLLTCHEFIKCSEIFICNLVLAECRHLAFTIPYSLSESTFIKACACKCRSHSAGEVLTVTGSTVIAGKAFGIEVAA